MAINSASYAETLDYRSFLIEKANMLESRIARGDFDWNDVDTFETLTLRIQALTIQLERHQERTENKTPFWKPKK